MTGGWTAVVVCCWAGTAGARASATPAAHRKRAIIGISAERGSFSPRYADTRARVYGAPSARRPESQHATPVGAQHAEERAERPACAEAAGGVARRQRHGGKGGDGCARAQSPAPPPPRAPPPPTPGP